MGRIAPKTSTAPVKYYSYHIRIIGTQPQNSLNSVRHSNRHNPKYYIYIWQLYVEQSKHKRVEILE
jgi:hypothetical protein